MNEAKELPLSSTYLREVLERLASLGFTSSANVPFRGEIFAHVARKKVFGMEFVGFVETFFVLSLLDTVDIGDLRAYSRTCFAFSLEASGVRLPRGCGYRPFCYPVAVVNSVSSALADVLKNTDPPHHWGAYEFPVVCHPATGRVLYSEKSPWTAWTGYEGWDEMRRTIAEVLAPSAESGNAGNAAQP
ncbi:MAG: hypothetical protein NTU41_06875 [Chloroflexi bacterium]|nr:hypothetical protein [Chloroflexota bacterium]